MIQGVGQQVVLPKQAERRDGRRSGKESMAVPKDPKAKSEVQATRQDVYVQVSQVKGKVTYDRPKGASAETIQRLKEESEQVFSQLRDLVRQLLERQGLSFQDILVTEGEEGKPVEIDGEAMRDAQALIAEGGPLSPDAVSDRIVNMAIALAGEDPERMALMRTAIEDGFRAAAELFGGQLPDISYETYDLIQEKLDAWETEA